MVAVSPSAITGSAAGVPQQQTPPWRSGPNLIAALAATGVAVHLLLRYVAGASRNAWQAPLIVVLVVAGIPLVVPLVRKAFSREFGSDHLAGISILTSALLGEYLVGSIVILMLSGGTALEGFATRRASAVLDALARRVPQTAHRKSAEGVASVALAEIAVGDTLVILPHEICPADGVVVEGRGVMNEAYLTGEPFEIEKAPGAEVLSGSVNGDSALTVRAEKLPVDSRYARIMRVMEETEQRRPHLRRLGDKLGAWYTPLALAVAGAAWAASGSNQRFLAVLVVATPCPLLIAIPVAVIGAISLAARRGIIIKNPAVLEQIDRCTTVVFDKTGTLTYGKPTLSEAHTAEGREPNEVLRLAASLERYSKHPLSTAIQEAAQKAGLSAEPVSSISERPGEGLQGEVSGRHVWITSRQQIRKPVPPLPAVTSGLECVVIVEGAYAGMFRFHDEPRKESAKFIGHLGPRHAVNRVMIVSGDRDEEVRRLAGKVGIREVYSAKSPEEKVEIVRAAATASPTLFLGDGINDAPAMQAATVGVAFGVKSDITSEAADAVVLETSLSRVDTLMHIGRRMRRIALESAAGGMALSILGMAAAALGYLPPIGGAIAQEVIDLAAVTNAVRVAFSREAMTDF